jgi:hypothetical protein
VDRSARVWLASSLSGIALCLAGAAVCEPTGAQADPPTVMTGPAHPNPDGSVALTGSITPYNPVAWLGDGLLL